MSEISQGEREGIAVYSRAFLSVYDLYVLGFSNSVIWRCPSSGMLRQYEELTTGRHLEIGAGTGWYLRNTTHEQDSAVTLMDLNDSVLDVASRRLRDAGYAVDTHAGSVLQPIGLPRRFSSISANYLFHCVPGTWEEKGAAFGYIADVLEDDGVFFGATILGKGGDHWLLSDATNWAYNHVLKVFHNEADDAAGLRVELEKAFEEVDIRLHRSVALFQARRPRRGKGEEAAGSEGE